MTSEIKKVLARKAHPEVGVQHVKHIALGEDVQEVGVVDVAQPQPVTIEERIEYLEMVVQNTVMSLDSIFALLKELRDASSAAKDKKIVKEIEAVRSDDTIPVGTQMYGTTKGLTYWLEVKEDGFWVGNTKYGSVSAAAKGVSGVRRSGWAFWKLPDGRTLKEVYRG